MQEPLLLQRGRGAAVRQGDAADDRVQRAEHCVLRADEGRAGQGE